MNIKNSLEKKKEPDIKNMYYFIPFILSSKIGKTKVYYSDK